MIEPVKHGQRLLDEIDTAVCATPTLWWLGHSGFVVKYHRTVIYIDPFLSADRARLTALPLQAESIHNAGLILATHAHACHLDPSTLGGILSASPRAKLVLPIRAGEEAHSFGIGYDRMVTTNSDLRVEYLDDRVYAVPSAHEQLDWTPLGGYPYLGYLVRFGNYTIYHAGDCVPYPGLVSRLLPYNVNVALLPINGRGRGFPGNFDIAEAAQLSQEIGADWLVPMHYNMFARDNVDIDRFIEHMLGHRPSQRFKVFDCGEMWPLPAVEA